MTDDPGRKFLSRWSRRKIEARAAERGAPAEENEATPAAPPPVVASDLAAAPVDPAEQAPAPDAALPDPETLRGLESDYRGFLRPEVDESLRRTALKKLFADPHFNVMDGLDVYIDDYSKPDPISPALLRTMNQARGLRLFEDEENEAASNPAEVADAEVVALQQTEVAAGHASAPGQEEAVPVASTDCPVGPEPSPLGDVVPEMDRKKG